MTEQSPAEVAAATAEHATASSEATSPNADLVGGIVPEAPLPDPMAIPHAHHVLPSSPAPAPAKVSTPSALLAEKLAAIPPGAKPVKRKYAYQRRK